MSNVEKYKGYFSRKKDGSKFHLRSELRKKEGKKKIDVLFPIRSIFDYLIEYISFELLVYFRKRLVYKCRKENSCKTEKNCKYRTLK